MPDPTNNFSNFFDNNDPHPMMHEFKPSIHEVIFSLVELVMRNPTFYKDQKLRLVASAAMAYATQELADAKERNERPKDVTAGDAAFMMLLGDMMSMTYDEFAGDLERKHFPHNRREYINDIEEELGNNDEE
jgi:hypothetical protein